MLQDGNQAFERCGKINGCACAAADVFKRGHRNTGLQGSSRRTYERSIEKGEQMNLEKQAIDILQTFAGNEPYQLGYSGGKDSDVILHLAKKAGVPFVAVHNLTTVDAPETVRYIKSKPEVLIEYPKMSMWQLIVKHKTPPTRLFRYCCAELKERSGIGKKLVTGVRKAESKKRAKNQGAVTFTKPNKEIKNSVDNKNFLLTAAGGWLY